MSQRRSKRKAAVLAQDAIRQQIKKEKPNQVDEAMLSEDEDLSAELILFCNEKIALQQELFQHILAFLPKRNLVHSASLVCKAWNKATQNPELWPVLDASIWKKYPRNPAHNNVPCKMVFRSTRQFFMFLRRPQFARLKTLVPPDIYRTILRNVFDKIAQICPQLEELDVSGSNTCRLLCLVPFAEELPRLPQLFPRLKKLRVCLRHSQRGQLEDFVRGMGERLVELSVDVYEEEPNSPHYLLDETLEIMAQICPNLEGFHYDARFSRLSERGPKALLQKCPNLRSLKITLPYSVCPNIGDFVKEQGYETSRGLDLCLMVSEEDVWMMNVFDDSSDEEDDEEGED